MKEKILTGLMFLAFTAFIVSLMFVIFNPVDLVKPISLVEPIFNPISYEYEEQFEHSIDTDFHYTVDARFDEDECVLTRDIINMNRPWADVNETFYCTGVVETINEITYSFIRNNSQIQIVFTKDTNEWYYGGQ